MCPQVSRVCRLRNPGMEQDGDRGRHCFSWWKRAEGRGKASVSDHSFQTSFLPFQLLEEAEARNLLSSPELEAATNCNPWFWTAMPPGVLLTSLSICLSLPHSGRQWHTWLSPSPSRRAPELFSPRDVGNPASLEPELMLLCQLPLHSCLVGWVGCQSSVSCTEHPLSL